MLSCSRFASYISLQSNRNKSNVSHWTGHKTRHRKTQLQPRKRPLISKRRYRRRTQRLQNTYKRHGSLTTKTKLTHHGPGDSQMTLLLVSLRFGARPDVGQIFGDVAVFDSGPNGTNESSANVGLFSCRFIYLFIRLLAVAQFIFCVPLFLCSESYLAAIYSPCLARYIFFRNDVILRSQPLSRQAFSLSHGIGNQFPFFPVSAPWSIRLLLSRFRFLRGTAVSPFLNAPGFLSCFYFLPSCIVCSLGAVSSSCAVAFFLTRMLCISLAFSFWCTTIAHVRDFALFYLGFLLNETLLIWHFIFTIVFISLPILTSLFTKQTRIISSMGTEFSTRQKQNLEVAHDEIFTPG